MRVMLVALPLLVVAAGALPAQADFNPPANGHSTATSSGYALTLAAVHRLDEATGHTYASGTGPRYFYDFMPACGQNRPGDGDVVCAAAVTACARRTPPMPGAMLFWIFRGTDPAALAEVGSVCLGADDFVDPEQLARDVSARVADFLALARPQLTSAPADRLLVNLPTVWWAQDPATATPAVESPRQVTLTVDGVSVTLTATAAWHWTFGDGADANPGGAGVAFSLAHDPRTDPGYYAEGVLHTYHAAGRYPVSLTVTWSPSYELTYQVGHWDTTPVVYRVDRVVTVHEAHAVLVNR